MQISVFAVPARWLVVLAMAAFCFLTPPARAQSGAQALQGWWLDQTGRGGVVIAPCGTKLCGNIEWLKIPRDSQGKLRTDSLNPNPAMTSRPLCGLPVLWNFVADGSGGWTGGYVYDPDTGKTYTSNMHLQADGSLNIHGYIGIPLLGRSVVWTRLPAPLPHCTDGK